MQRWSKFIVSALKSGGVGVLPTDTIYGLVGSALNPKAVRRIYRLRRRDPKKPMIILIDSLAQLKLFGVKPDKETTRLLKTIWLGRKSAKRHTNILENVGMSFGNGTPLWKGRPTSVALSLRQISNVKCQKFQYLHRGTNSLAFRLPKPRRLRQLLAKTGPLVAPSANWEGRPPARTIKEARGYFSAKDARSADPLRRVGDEARTPIRRGFASGGNDKADFYIDGGKISGKPSLLIKIERGKIKILRK